MKKRDCDWNCEKEIESTYCIHEASECAAELGFTRKYQNDWKPLCLLIARNAAIFISAMRRPEIWCPKRCCCLPTPITCEESSCTAKSFADHFESLRYGAAAFLGKEIQGIGNWSKRIYLHGYTTYNIWRKKIMSARISWEIRKKTLEV